MYGMDRFLLYNPLQRDKQHLEFKLELMECNRSCNRVIQGCHLSLLKNYTLLFKYTDFRIEMESKKTVCISDHLNLNRTYMCTPVETQNGALI